MTVSEALFSSNSDEWYTPLDLVTEIKSLVNIKFDAAATSGNAICSNFADKERDGLSLDWDQEANGGVTWCNPPYSVISGWVEKASKHSSILLIPARTDTRYWHNFIFPKATAILFIKGRLKFSGAKSSAPFPSALVFFNTSIPPELAKLGHITYLQPIINGTVTQRPVDVNVVNNNAIKKP